MAGNEPQPVYLALEGDTENVDSEIYEIENDVTTEAEYVYQDDTNNDENDEADTFMKVGDVKRMTKDDNSATEEKCDDDQYYNTKKAFTNETEQQIYENVDFRGDDDAKTLPSKKARRLYENTRNHKSIIETNKAVVTCDEEYTIDVTNSQTKTPPSAKVTNSPKSAYIDMQHAYAGRDSATGLHTQPSLPPRLGPNPVRNPGYGTVQEEYSVATEPAASVPPALEEYAIADGPPDRMHKCARPQAEKGNVKNKEQEEYTIPHAQEVYEIDGTQEEYTIPTTQDVYEIAEEKTAPHRIKQQQRFTSHEEYSTATAQPVQNTHQDYKDYRESQHPAHTRPDDVTVDIKPKPPFIRLPSRGSEQQSQSLFAKHFNPVGNSKAKRNIGIVLVVLALIIIIIVLATQV